MPAVFGVDRMTLSLVKYIYCFYLATCDNIQSMVAQGRTIAEIIEIAKEFAKELIEAQEDQIPKLKDK